MVGTFLPQMASSDATQLFIDQWNKDLEGFLIPGSPLTEQGAHRLGRRFGHTHTLGLTKQLELNSKNNVRDT